MRRKKQQLSSEECFAILKNEPRGVMSVYGEDGYPYGFPMNHFYDEETNKLYFHCAKTGHKLDAIKKDERVSFCVYDKGFRKDGEWALNIKSVILFGKIRIVTEPEVILDKIRKLGFKHDPNPESVEEEIKKGLVYMYLLELSIEHMTGKLVNES